MKAIDLFCGIGGFHYAAKANGIDVVFASEIDKYAVSEYEANHGLRPHGDITKIEAADIPPHDLLMGGFPCQAFSLAGKRMGFDDTRGTLFFDIARIMKQHKPRFALLENVPNLRSHDKGKTIKVILDTLQELGYFIKTDILDSANFGVAQRRQRFFIACFLDKADYFNFTFPKANEEPQLCLADILEENVPEKYFLSEKGVAYVKKRQPKFTQINPEQSPALLSTYGNLSNGAYFAPEATTGKFRQGERIYKGGGLTSCPAIVK